MRRETANVGPIFSSATATPPPPSERFDVVDLFDAAFELREQMPEAHVLRFAMGVVRHATLLRPNWPIVESLLLQALVVEPGICREVLTEFVKYQALGYPLNLQRIGESLAQITIRHAPLGHGSEVAWAIWSHIALGIPLYAMELAAVEAMDDPVVVLVALDAGRRGLLPRQAASPVWMNMMTFSELTGAGWLLAYEAAVKGWLPANYIQQSPDFATMRTANVSFYDILPNPNQAAINLAPPGVGGVGWS